MNIGIIGLGLMGGSLGMALKKFPKKYHIIGYDHNQKHQKEALLFKLLLWNIVAHFSGSMYNCAYDRP